MKVIALEHVFGRNSHWAELAPVEALIGELVRNDDMALGIASGLDIIADHAAMPGTGRDGAGIGIRQENLPIRGIEQGFARRLTQMNDGTADRSNAEPGKNENPSGRTIISLLAGHRMTWLSFRIV